MKEFTGYTDRNGTKLYLNDKVKAPNGAIGIINKHEDTWTFNEPQMRYHVEWGKYTHENLGGITNENIEKI